MSRVFTCYTRIMDNLRKCRICRVELEKKLGKGRWPSFCDECRPIYNTVYMRMAKRRERSASA